MQIQFLNLAYRYYRIASESNDPAALCSVGFCMDNGYGVAKDMEGAIRCYEASAALGNKYAQYNLGQCYYFGRNGTRVDYAKAIGHYRQAADQNHTGALYRLAKAYENGKGLPKDAHLAFAYALKAAELGHAGAQTDVGFFYERGLGVEKNQTSCVKWTKKGADGGNADAQCNLGH